VASVNPAIASRLRQLEILARRRRPAVDDLPVDPGERARLYREMVAEAPADPDVRAALGPLSPIGRFSAYRARLKGAHDR
jgi:hypothetical protein